MAFFLGRILFGGYFLVAGVRHVFTQRAGMIGYAQMKKVFAPNIAVVGSGILLLVGGIGIIFWIYVRIAILALLIFLIPVSFMMHAYWKDTDESMKTGNRVNFWKNMALVGALLMFLFFL